MIKVFVHIAPALAPSMSLALGTMLKRFMTITNIIEEVDLVFISK